MTTAQTPGTQDGAKLADELERHARRLGGTAARTEEQFEFVEVLREAAKALRHPPAAVAQLEDNKWIEEARKTLDHLSGFLQHLGCEHRVDWREWIDCARQYCDALKVEQGTRSAGRREWLEVLREARDWLTFIANHVIKADEYRARGEERIPAFLQCDYIEATALFVDRLNCLLDPQMSDALASAQPRAERRTKTQWAWAVGDGISSTDRRAPRAKEPKTSESRCLKATDCTNYAWCHRAGECWRDTAISQAKAAEQEQAAKSRPLAESVSAIADRTEPSPVSAATPAEWVRVPREPTVEMVNAGRLVLLEQNQQPWTIIVKNAYAAMLAALPSLPADKGDAK